MFKEFFLLGGDSNNNLGQKKQFLCSGIGIEFQWRKLPYLSSKEM